MKDLRVALNNALDGRFFSGTVYSRSEVIDAICDAGTIGVLPTRREFEQSMSSHGIGPISIAKAVASLRELEFLRSDPVLEPLAVVELTADDLVGLGVPHRLITELFAGSKTVRSE